MRNQNNGDGAGKTDDQPGAVLITGAAGFGGSYLTRALLHLGYRVTGLDTTPPSHAGLLRRELEHPNFRYLWKSLQDIQPDDVDGHSVVAHLAAQADTPLAFEFSPLHGDAEHRRHRGPVGGGAPLRRD